MTVSYFYFAAVLPFVLGLTTARSRPVRVSPDWKTSLYPYTDVYPQFLGAPRQSNLNSTYDFPPSGYLGYGIDMTQLMPLDIKTVTDSIIKAWRIINLSEDSTEQDYEDLVKWRVPNNCDLNRDVDGGGDLVNIYRNGKEAFDDTKIGGRLKGRYEVVSGDVSLDMGLRHSFQDNYQYLMMSYDQKAVTASFQNWGPSLNTVALKRLVSILPDWNPENERTVHKYRGLFANAGTHIITEATYGSRLSLAVWASNENSEVNKDFAASVAVEFNGLTAQGEIDANVAHSTQYKEFHSSSSSVCTVSGGDRALGHAICSQSGEEDGFSIYQDWIKSAGTYPDVVSFFTRPLWDVIQNADDSSINSRGYDIQAAYEYISRLPCKHYTLVRMTVSADWAEFTLLSPSSFIMVAPAFGGFTVSDTKVEYQVPGGGSQLREQQFDFTIVSSTAVVDFDMAHGSGYPVTVKFPPGPNQKTYTNDDITDNKWNIKRFQQAPTDAVCLEPMTSGNNASVATPASVASQ